MGNDTDFRGNPEHLPDRVVVKRSSEVKGVIEGEVRIERQIETIVAKREVRQHCSTISPFPATGFMII